MPTENRQANLPYMEKEYQGRGHQGRAFYKHPSTDLHLFDRGFPSVIEGVFLAPYYILQAPLAHDDRKELLAANVLTTQYRHQRNPHNGGNGLEGNVDDKYVPFKHLD